MSISIPSQRFNSRRSLLKAWQEIFPGIDRVVVLFEGLDGSVNGKEYIKSGQEYHLRSLIITGNESRIKKVFSEKPGYIWLHKEQIPFEHINESDGQLHIFSEYHHVVLSLRIRRDAERIDCFYLFFREDQSNFGVSSLRGVLDTSRKALIASIVYRFARFYYQSNHELTQSINRFTDLTRKVVEDNKLESKNNNKHRDWLRGWACDFLDKIRAASHPRISLTEGALVKLASISDYKRAKQILSDAAQFSLMLNFNKTSKDEIFIEENFIVIDDGEVLRTRKSKTDAPSPPKSKIAKTRALLDKLERAAQGLNDRGDDITSVAVGKSLERPITAPAISDALRKNSSRIMTLLNKHQESWPVIRNNFRPLINIIEKSQDIQQTG